MRVVPLLIALASLGCGDDTGIALHDMSVPLDLSAPLDLFAPHDLARGSSCIADAGGPHDCSPGESSCCAPCPLLEPTIEGPCSFPGLMCVYLNVMWTCGADGIFRCQNDSGRDCFDAGH